MEGFDANEFSDIASLLVGHGVSEVDAQRFLCSVVKSQRMGDSKKSVGLFEVYGQGGLTRAAAGIAG